MLIKSASMEAAYRTTSLTKDRTVLGDFDRIFNAAFCEVFLGKFDVALELVLQKLIGFRRADDVHAALKYLTISATVDASAWCLVEVQRDDDVICPEALMPRSWVMMNGVEQLVTMRRARPPVRNCMPLSPWVPDDEVGVLLNSDVIDVFENRSDANGRAHRVRVLRRGLFFPASMRKRHVISFLEPMMWSNMISLSNALPTTIVFEGDVTTGVILGDKDALLCHGVDQFLSEGSSLPMILVNLSHEEAPTQVDCECGGFGLEIL